MSIITEESFQYLRKLKNNNNRPWFEKNQPQYERSRAEFTAFVTRLADGIKKIETIPEKDPSKYIFRIYRDIRFSKDKTPYKVFFSCLIQRGPEETVCPFYVQLQPGGSMIGGGVWDPSAEILRKIRQEIVYNGASLRKIIRTSSFTNHFSEIRGERLARPPKGYDAVHPEIELLKMKQFFIRRNIEDDMVLSRELIPEILKSYRAARPFFGFFDTAMAD